MAEDQPPTLDSLWNFGRPSESEVRFRTWMQRDDVTDEQKLEAATQIARCLGLQRKFTDAHAQLDSIQSSCEKPNRVRVRYLLERGRVYNSSGKTEQATEQFLHAVSLAESIGEEGLAVDAAHMLGISEPGSKGLDWNLRAIEMAEEYTAPDAKKWLGSLHNNTGWTYFEMQDFDMALVHFEKAEHFRRAEGDPQKILIAQYAVAKAKRMLGMAPDAIEILRMLIVQDPDDGFLHEEMAECLVAIGMHGAAKSFFLRAYEILSQNSWLMNDDPHRVYRLKHMAERENVGEKDVPSV